MVWGRGGVVRGHLDLQLTPGVGNGNTDLDSGILMSELSECLDMWKWADEDMRRQGVSDEERFCQMEWL